MDEGTKRGCTGAKVSAEVLECEVAMRLVEKTGVPDRQMARMSVEEYHEQ
jgi:hypothetical protein